jgi:rhodanese-related sulfurtransferase
MTLAQFLWDNILLVGLLLVSGGMLIWPLIGNLVSGARQLGTLEATRIMNTGNALVLDVRETAEFAAGRIPKSKNVPLAELGKRADEISRFKDKPVIVTCATGSRSLGALKALKAAGFSDLYALKGGIASWREATLPLEK